MLEGRNTLFPITFEREISSPTDPTYIFFSSRSFERDILFPSGHCPKLQPSKLVSNRIIYFSKGI